MRVKELAAWLNAVWEGNGESEMRRVAPIEEAGPEDLAFVSQGRAAKDAGASRAGCLLVREDFFNPTGRTVIRIADPRAAVARVIPKLHPRVKPQPGIHPTAVIGPGSIVAKTAFVGPLVTIGAAVRIGEHASIGAGSVIGDHVYIGDGCILHARVTIYPEVIIGIDTVL